MTDTLFELVTLCPECGSDNVIKHYFTDITGRPGHITITDVDSYHCNDCLTWFAPGEGVSK